MDKDFKSQEKRIQSIFPRGRDSLKSEETLNIYRDFLNENLKYPVRLTGIEDFSWEEFYVFGPGDKKEYKELKKTRASYTDIFKLNSIGDDLDEHYGLFAMVAREGDRKKFQIPLADLKAVQNQTRNYQLLDDYSVWCVNY